MKMLALAVFCVVGVSGQNLTGKWNVQATPEGKQAIKLDASLNQDGEALTGVVNSSMGSGPVKNAVLGAPEITFQFMIGKYTFDVKAVAQGDEMKGTFKGPLFMKGTFFAKRAESGLMNEGVEIGKLGEAEYRIDIPSGFNGTLIMYCHGYSPSPGKFDAAKPPSPWLKIFLSRGYAVAQSGYSRGGWAVEEAIAETEQLRKHFVGKYGSPKRTFVMGHSMGGLLTIATAETYPEAYDGALQICGPTGASVSSLQRIVFDLLVVYDYYFPGLIGSPTAVTDEIDQGQEFVLRVQKEATQYPDRLSAFLRWSGLQTDTEMASVVVFFAGLQRELMQRAGGNPFDNRDTLYQGSDNDVLLNRGVKRYAAEAKAADYLRKNYTPRLSWRKPLLSVHTTYDPLIPSWSANTYGELLRATGGAANYVQRFIPRSGHCALTAEETLHALEDLAKWQESGQRPPSGEQK